MKLPTDNELIKGIRHHESPVLDYVYDTYYPIIEGYIIHNQGSCEEARDIFQEAMIVVYNRIKSDQLELTCKFGTYLYAICKNMWIQERKKYLLRAEKLKQQPLVVNDPGPADDPLLQNHLSHLFNKHFGDLSEDCQKILSMYFNNFSVEDIRTAMNYKDLHHTADRKYRCKKSLVKRIVNDPLFKKLKNELR
ncbi:MAG: sigma-70 family RNA polymerase sigma factor [Bacteroidia bacterium]|nr:MAG: sigma-70 family RNA polymerase sigma factor [Bacteroidia bacterium]